jgi:hypothetical protein
MIHVCNIFKPRMFTLPVQVQAATSSVLLYTCRYSHTQHYAQRTFGPTLRLRLRLRLIYLKSDSLRLRLRADSDSEHSKGGSRGSNIRICFYLVAMISPLLGALALRVVGAIDQS